MCQTKFLESPTIKSHRLKEVEYELDQSPLLMEMNQLKSEYEEVFGNNPDSFNEIRTKLTICHARRRMAERRACRYIASMTLRVLRGTRFPSSLQEVARIMRRSGFDTCICPRRLKCSCYDPVCKNLAKEVVEREFNLSEDEEEKVLKFIDSNPKFGGVPIFPDSHQLGCKGLDGVRRRIKVLEHGIRYVNSTMTEDIYNGYDDDLI